MKIPMTALRAFSYAHRALRPGVGFSVKSERDARLLEAIGRARRSVEPPEVAPPVPKVKRTYKKAEKAAQVVEAPKDEIPEAPTAVPDAPVEDDPAKETPAEEPNAQQDES